MTKDLNDIIEDSQKWCDACDAEAEKAASEKERSDERTVRGQEQPAARKTTTYLPQK